MTKQDDLISPLKKEDRPEKVEGAKMGDATRTEHHVFHHPLGEQAKSQNEDHHAAQGANHSDERESDFDTQQKQLMSALFLVFDREDFSSKEVDNVKQLAHDILSHITQTEGKVTREAMDRDVESFKREIEDTHKKEASYHQIIRDAIKDGDAERDEDEQSSTSNATRLLESRLKILQHERQELNGVLNVERTLLEERRFVDEQLGCHYTINGKFERLEKEFRKFFSKEKIAEDTSSSEKLREMDDKLLRLVAHTRVVKLDFFAECPELVEELHEPPHAGAKKLEGTRE